MKRLPLQLLHHTPETVQDLPDLKFWFDNIPQMLRYEDKERLCNWPSHYVEVAILLLCHTFHAERVQCFFLPDSFLPETLEETLADEQLIHVGSNVTMLLGVVWKPDHFAVVWVHLKNQMVHIWDSGIDQEEIDTAETSWYEHIVYLIRSHQPTRVTYDKNNAPKNIIRATTSKQKKWKKIWKINALKVWPQPNNYVCGAISLNRFAKIQKSETVLIKSPDKLQDDNVSKAAELFEYLVKNAHNGICITNNDEKDSQKEDLEKEKLSKDDFNQKNRKKNQSKNNQKKI